MEVVLRIIDVVLAIVVGCGGTIGVFYLANLGVNALREPWNRHLLPWVYIGPAMIFVSLYLILPTIKTIYLSLFDARSQNFVGLSNYLFAFSNQGMLIAFRNNLLWLILVTGISVSLGLIIAVLVDRVRYEAIVKSLIFLPMAISFVGASAIWKFMYAYKPKGDEQIGLLNAIVVNLGFNPVGWLVERSVNNLALIVIMIWLYTGFCMVILSAAVKGIPEDVIEAARIDGANSWQIFWRVTVPMIRSSILVVSTTVVILVLKVFDIVFVMTGGNQGTEVIASRMIKEMFNFRNFGRGSAIAVILLILIIPVMVANIRRFRAEEKLR